MRSSNLVETTGLEPVTPCLQGRRSPNDELGPQNLFGFPGRISESCFLYLHIPSRESGTRSWCLNYRKPGGAREIQTPDLSRAKRPLSQLSYSPETVPGNFTLAIGVAGGS